MTNTTSLGAYKFLAGLFVALSSLFLLLLVNATPAGATANPSNFDPGNIIDDSIFYSSSSMTASQIQNFLDSKVPVCDTYGTGPAVGFNSSMTRAAYAASRGWQSPPYTCLRNYSQATPQMEAASRYCAALPAYSSRSAPNIIKDIATACGINPQVLLVLLEKEQSLVTDVWPLNSQFTKATGFACPDTAACNPNYGGFFYQVYYAARQYKVYQANPNNYNYIAGRYNRIYWQTNLGNWVNSTGNYNSSYTSCGYSNVYIQNQATAALYIYTPYQPNQKALANLYGSGDSCSAYGNRNFWRLFTDWFGNTHGFIYAGTDYRSTFDPAYYANNNPDVKAAFGDDQMAMFYHFLYNGLREGRQATADFNVNSYKTRYPDLRAAYGNDLQKYLWHYTTTGKGEGRIGTGDYRGGTTVYGGIDYKNVYNFDYYTRTYPDIWAAYGLNDEKALWHFINVGAYEGRQAIATFNVNSYKTRYPDLRAAYGNDLQKYLWHYTTTGIKEGRTGL